MKKQTFKKIIATTALILIGSLGIHQNSQAASTKITLSAVGDCTLGADSRYNTYFNNYYRQYGDTYFLKKVKGVFEKDDVTLVNFEGTLTSRTSRRSKAFTFKGPAKYVNILTKSSVEMVNLANNHSEDFGTLSYRDTVETIKANGIGYCRNTAIWYKTVNGVKIAFLGFDAVDGVTTTQVKNGIKTAKDHKAKLIIVTFHWGIERSTTPNSKQKNLGHLAIDQGASLVIGHHPHVLQGIETYKGKHILYSLGNFCFGGNSNPKDKDTMIYQETFTVTDGKLSAANGYVIPCSLSSSTNKNDYQPRILTSTAKTRVMNKIKSLSKGLKTTITSEGQVKVAK